MANDDSNGSDDGQNLLTMPQPNVHGGQEVGQVCGRSLFQALDGFAAELALQRQGICPTCRAPYSGTVDVPRPDGWANVRRVPCGHGTALRAPANATDLEMIKGPLFP